MMNFKNSFLIIIMLPSVIMARDITYRPWGYYDVISDTSTYKLKQLVIYPQQRISLQRHQKREEHWIFIHGKGIITLNENKIPVGPGSMIHVKLRDVHRIENTGNENLELIEVQRGTYFGEDDIEQIK